MLGKSAGPVPSKATQAQQPGEQVSSKQQAPDRRSMVAAPNVVTTTDGSQSQEASTGLTKEAPNRSQPPLLQQEQTNDGFVPTQASQSTTQSKTQPKTQPTSQPTSQLTSQLISQPTSQPTTLPTSEPKSSQGSVFRATNGGSSGPVTYRESGSSQTQTPSSKLPVTRTRDAASSTPTSKVLGTQALRNHVSTADRGSNPGITRRHRRAKPLSGSPTDPSSQKDGESAPPAVSLSVSAQSTSSTDAVKGSAYAQRLPEQQSSTTSNGSIVVGNTNLHGSRGQAPLATGTMPTTAAGVNQIPNRSQQDAFPQPVTTGGVNTIPQGNSTQQTQLPQPSVTFPSGGTSAPATTMPSASISRNSQFSTTALQFPRSYAQPNSSFPPYGSYDRNSSQAPPIAGLYGNGNTYGMNNKIASGSASGLGINTYFPPQSMTPTYPNLSNNYNNNGNYNSNYGEYYGGGGRGGGGNQSHQDRQYKQSGTGLRSSLSTALSRTSFFGCFPLSKWIM